MTASSPASRAATDDDDDDAVHDLHDAAHRGLLATIDDWDLRWPAGSDLGARWTLAGLFHVHASHPKRGVSALIFHGSRWITRYELYVVGEGRWSLASPAAVAAALAARGIPPLPIERVERVAAAAFARSVDALGSMVAATRACAVHAGRLARA